MIVALARMYSRNSGATSDESETSASGNTSRRIAPARSSCAGLRRRAEADRDCFDTGLAQLGGGLAQRVLVQ